MKVRVLKKDKNELRVEVSGEGHSFCNALQKALLEDEQVQFAGYDLPHPLVSQPVIYVQTKGRRKPEDAFIEAASKLGGEMEEFLKAFEGATQGRKKPEMPKDDR